jgi:hypothetical protein
MEFLEKDLEEIIYLSDKDKLQERGLYLTGKLKRQLRIGNYGIADLIEIKKPYYHNKRFYKGCINIIELKKDKIGVSTFFQALNYLQGVKTYLEDRKLGDLFNYKITLIGKGADTNSSFVFLGDIFNNEINDCDIIEHHKTKVELFTYKYGVEGVEFTQMFDYNLKNKGF